MHAWNWYGIILINQLMLFSCPVMSASVTPWTAACQASLSLTISRSLAKFTFIASVKPSSHLILWRPLLLLPSILPSIRDFCNELSLCIRWPKYGSFHFSISPFSEYSGLISLKTGLIFLLSKEFSGVFSSTTFEGINSLAFCLLYGLAIPIKLNYLYFLKEPRYELPLFSLSLPPWLWKLLPKGTLHLTQVGYIVSAKINLYFVVV